MDYTTSWACRCMLIQDPERVAKNWLFQASLTKDSPLVLRL